MSNLPVWMVLLLTLVVANAKQCSYSRVANKYEQKFSDFSEGDILVEARYRLNRKRFEIIRLWNDDGGLMDVNADFQVSFDDSLDAVTAECYKALSNERYLLALRSNGDGYYPVLPPLPIRKHSKRHDIWGRWCVASPESCELKISRAGFPPIFTLHRNAIIIANCHVSSKATITGIEWRKDGQVIDERTAGEYASYGLFVNRLDLEDGRSELIISSASDLHTGTYSCMATDSEGVTVEMKSEFVRAGDDSMFTSCPAGKEKYCLSGSTCRGVVRVPDAVVCLCPSGFHGKRCHNVDTVDLTSFTYKNGDQTIEQLRSTTVVLGIVCIITGLCFGIALVGLYRLKRKWRHHSRKYHSPSDLEKTVSHTDLETADGSLENV